MMVLYSKPTCPWSHQCRFVLYEKNMDFEVRDVDYGGLPQEVSRLTSHTHAPLLVDRDLALYEPKIINEYIDERYPHPQLVPGDPAERARVRLFLLNFEKELFFHVTVLERRKSKESVAAQNLSRIQLHARLTELTPLFRKNMYILGTQFSMLDVALGPVLWRLNHYGIEMGKNAAPLLKYAERIFSRPAFIESLTSFERAMRK